ncbi:hypothetical protein NQ315_012994 [Exocentrus adspersus]|uniref:DNA-directed DNA polymerase n=1 Tax=Exocentrus adspersus TaxID=1586481 RepID=A0AAV8VT69_9CUCU|nr:hypothetical protein NQ315_012994 [Exocentrus adspersus]
MTMYDFHYNVIKKKYNTRAKLLYTDTDSLVYDIQTEDVYDDMKRNIDKFDTSNYNPPVNKAVLGVFKDENAGEIMLEFEGLRAKLYNFVVGKDYGVTKKAKGVKKCVVKRLKHGHYRNCLLNKKMHLCRQNLFKCIKHQINKIALSPFDDKIHFAGRNFNSGVGSFKANISSLLILDFIFKGFSNIILLRILNSLETSSDNFWHVSSIDVIISSVVYSQTMSFQLNPTAPQISYRQYQMNYVNKLLAKYISYYIITTLMTKYNLKIYCVWDMKRTCSFAGNRDKPFFTLKTPPPTPSRPQIARRSLKSKRIKRPAMKRWSSGPKLRGLRSWRFKEEG